MLWPLIARAVYRELLDLSWDAGGLPADPEELRALVRASEQEWERAWPLVEGKFPVSEDGLRRNLRLEIHRIEARKQATTAHDRAVAAARARWGGGGDASDAPSDAPSIAAGNASGTPQAMPSNSNSNSNSSTNAKKPDSGTSARYARSGVGDSKRAFAESVAAVYDEICTDLPRTRTLTDGRVKALWARREERIREGKPAGELGYWRGFFAEVHASDFLCGRTSPADGRASWRANFDWLMRPNNFAKMIEGCYSGRGGRNASR
jgi:uncharacterized protein YdaU (DUF1376 family)